MSRELFLLSPYRVPTHHTLTLTDDDTAAFLNGYLSLWHPALLRHATQPPRISPQYDHEEPREANIYAVPVSPPLFLPDDWDDRLRRVGAVSYRATPNREETIANMLTALSLSQSPLHS